MSEAPPSTLDAPTAMWLLVGLGVLWIILGWWLARRFRALDQYMLAGRNVGLALATATTMVTWITSSTTMVASQMALQLGFWGMVGFVVGAVGLLLFAPLADRIRALMPHGYTSGDFMRLRYGKGVWRVFLAISLFFGLGWLVSLGMAGGLFVQALTGLDYRVGLTVILAISVTYTALGGLRAVIGTDFIQALMVLGAAGVLAWFAVDHVGLASIHAGVLEERAELLSLVMPAAILFMVNYLFFGIGMVFHSNVWWSRAFAFRPGVGKNAFLAAGLLCIPVPVVIGFIALTVPELGLNIPVVNMVVPLVASELLGFTGAVLVFILVFTVVASSIDSLLAATSELITRDLYQRQVRPEASPEEMRRVARWTVVGLGVLVWLFGLQSLGSLEEILYIGGVLVASTIWPVAAGLYWAQTNRQGALLAMVLGSVAGLVVQGVSGLPVGALMSAAVSMAIVLLSTWVCPESYDWKALDEGPMDGAVGDAFEKRRRRSRK